MKKYFLLSLLIPVCVLAMTEEEKQKFWFKSPEMKLYHKRNRGNSAAAVLKKAAFKIPFPRKAPIAKFVTGGKIAKAGKTEYIKVPVSLKEEANVDRNAWIRFGLPLPEGGVFQTGNIRIVDSSGKEIPSQISITGFWQDQSIKWALVQFAAPVKAGEEVQYFAEFGNRIKAKKYSGITWQENADQLIINTGKITAVIDKKKFTLLKTVHRGKLWLGTFGGAVLKDDKTNNKFRLSPREPESFEISEAGPLRLTVRAAGKYWNWNGKKSCMDYVARISFYAGSEAIDIQYTHMNKEIAREFTDIKSLYIEFIPGGGVSGIRSALSPAGAKRVFQETDAFYSVDGGKRIAGRFSGSASTIGRRSVSFGIADAWQRYPKAVSFEGKKVFVELLPQQPHEEFNRDLPYYLVYPFCDGAYRFKWGMGFTERMRFDFSGADVEAELNRPVIAVLPESWYDKSGVFPGLNAPGFEKIDKKIISSFYMRQKQSYAQREFGYFNYGDSFGEKGVNWTNNEYDMAHGLFLTFLRTGNRDLFRQALAAARHQADVDICHAYPDPYYVGANIGHRGVHNGAYKRWTSFFNKYQSAANGHTWAWGMVNAWQIAGDAPVFDAALLLGEHIALAMAPNYVMGKHAAGPRECSWAMKAIGKLYEAVWDPVYLNAMRTLAMSSIRAGSQFKNGIWVFKNDRVLKERGEDVWSNTVFVTGIGLMGLCEYYFLSKDESVKPFIRKVADRIVCAFAPEHGCGFAYDVDENGRKLRYSITSLNFSIAPPLADAAVILNDPVLFDIARRSMASCLLRSPGFNGKMLAEYMSFLADFLRSYAKFPEKYRFGFDEKSMLDLALYAPVNNWCWRGPSPGMFRVKLLKDGKHKLHMQRWVTSYRIKVKVPGAGIRIADQKGRIVAEKSFDSSRGTLEMNFELAGKKGDVFDVVVRDHTNGDWSISPSENLIHAGVFDAKQMIRLARCGLNEFFFEIPAGKEAVIRYYGTHIGAFGIWVFDENGNIICSREGSQSKNAISIEPENRIRITIPAAERKRLYSIAVWADADAKLRIEQVECISGSSVYFK